MLSLGYGGKPMPQLHPLQNSKWTLVMEIIMWLAFWDDKQQKQPHGQINNWLEVCRGSSGIKEEKSLWVLGKGWTKADLRPLAMTHNQQIAQQILFPLVHAHLCLTLCDPRDWNPPGSSVHGILQARILSVLPFPPPGDLPKPGIEPLSLVSPALAGWSFITWATWEAGAHLLQESNSWVEPFTDLS